MTTPSIVERLVALPPLAEIPREQLEWLVEHGEMQVLDDGATARGVDSLRGLVVVISGRFSVRVDQGGVVREVREITPGRITGLLPYSRIMASGARGYLVADGPVECLLIRLDDIKEMTRHCYEFTAACVHEMLDRVRLFKSDDKHQEKMAALGRLSAGLAHELNNPASAVARAAGELDGCVAELVAAARALGGAGGDEEAAGPLRLLEAAAARTGLEPLGPLERADLEDRLAAWLEERAIDPGFAYPLVDAGVTVNDLVEAARSLEAGRLAAVVRYVAAGATARALTAGIASAAGRIHSLVAAVKKHTHMDRAPTVEPIALESHLADTVALMRSKASLKGVALNLRVDDDVPPVDGSVADLNQVWMHLVDNAIDAAPESGTVSIEMRRDRDAVVVRVVDDGPGIPAEDRERVFDPFFTTKDVGQGRGLGLDIVRTVVGTHRGSVDLTSVPGRTELRVTLPATGAAG